METNSRRVFSVADSEMGISVVKSSQHKDQGDISP